MKKLPVIVCSVLQAELRQIATQVPLGEIFVVDSSYHFNPEKLYNKVLSIIQENRLNEAILLYGECSAGFKMPFPGSQIYRFKKQNCIDLLVGSDAEYLYHKEKMFVLLPEWAHRWRELFYKWFGFDPQTLRVFMRELHNAIVCLDDGTIEITDELIKEIEEASGVSVRVETISLTYLSNTFQQLIEGVQGD